MEIMHLIGEAHEYLFAVPVFAPGKTPTPPEATQQGEVTLKIEVTKVPYAHKDGSITFCFQRAMMSSHFGTAWPFTIKNLGWAQCKNDFFAAESIRPRSMACGAWSGVPEAEIGMGPGDGGGESKIAK